MSESQTDLFLVRSDLSHSVILMMLSLAVALKASIVPKHPECGGLSGESKA
jgi:hypothetical protein